MSYDEVAQKIGDLEQAVMENTNLNQSEFKNEMLNLANELIDKARDLSGYKLERAKCYIILAQTALNHCY
jgi:hypothetical protein